MSKLLISGGRGLRGEIDIHGAKNSVLPILAACIINGSENIIHNCPDLSDVDFSLQILRHLGCRVTREDGTVCVDSSCISRYDIPDHLMRGMRSSVIFLGAVLGRMGKACMSFPGGCELGPRPIELHLSALRQLGASIVEESGVIFCNTKKITGREIVLSFPSVGATENIMLAACCGKGTTIIQNAAREPEIEDLQNFLIGIGANVSGAGTSTILIEGVNTFKKVEYSVMPDRIVASTLLCAAATAGGSLTLRKTEPRHLDTVIAVLRETGCKIECKGDIITVESSRALCAPKAIKTMPYPGFPTDAQAPVMAVTTLCKGTTVFVENIFSSRYRHCGELLRMGADIKVASSVCVVCGVDKLYGATVEATDLRGGAALVVAGLGAEGFTEISGIEHIDRGYEKIEDMLTRVGADVRRV